MNSKKRILFLISNLGYGGAEKVLVNLVNNMDKGTFDVTVQTLFDTGVNRKYIKSDVHYIPGLKHEFLGNSHLIRCLPAKWLYKFYIKDGYDIVVAFLEGNATKVLSGCSNPNTKKVAWVHIEMSSIRTEFKSKEEAVKEYDKFDKIVYVAQTVKEAFEKASKPFTQGCVLYNVNETDKIIKKSQEPFDDVIFNKNEINVISVAKIMQTKGFDRLAKVHKRLLDEGLKHHIYILGVGEEQKKIEQYLKENGLQDTFTFLGYRDNPYKYVKAADLYVCSSRREGFSTAVTEALIVGTPVVSTCCSGAYELLGENNEYGIVMDNSEEGIYEGMKKMLSDEKLRKYYSKMAELRGKEFSTEKTVAAVEEMFVGLFDGE